MPGSDTSVTAGARCGCTVRTVGKLIALASARPARTGAGARRRGTNPTAYEATKSAAPIDQAALQTARRAHRRRAGSRQSALDVRGRHHSSSGSCSRRRGLTSQAAVHDGHEEQRGEGRDQQPADDRAAERRVLLAALAEAERHRQHADDHRQRGHQHRTQPRRPGRQAPRRRASMPSCALVVGERDQQDASCWSPRRCT